MDDAQMLYYRNGLDHFRGKLAQYPEAVQASFYLYACFPFLPHSRLDPSQNHNRKLATLKLWFCNIAEKFQFSHATSVATVAMQNAKEHDLDLWLDTSTPTSLHETATALKMQQAALRTKDRKALFSSSIWKLSTFTSFHLLVIAPLSCLFSPIS